LIGYIIKRILASFVLLILMSTITFFIIEMTPGDPATLLLGQDATEKSIAMFRAEMGLDKAIYERYYNFISNAIRLDFGRSFQTQRPVIEEIKKAFPATLELSILSLLVAISIGIPAGVSSAVYQYSLFDKFIRFSVLLAVSIPIFWLGLMLILMFSVYLKLLPSFGRGGLQNLILPTATLSAYSVAIIIRMTRSSMLEVIRNEYITVARAKGLSNFNVIYKHALMNALIPIVTVIGLQFGFLLGGAVITETVFAWPGIGRLLMQAVFSRDYPVIRAGVLLISACFILVNLFVDILYHYIDPTVTFGKKGTR
jgi:peptide/nickel transport system permease protein